jgi:pheromone shutdown protein TraB
VLPTALLLPAPQVYLVATAHISEQAAQDVRDTIERVGPAVVVLELDEERMRRLVELAAAGDRYGLSRLQGASPWRIVLSGGLLTYAMGLVYVATGALMGSRPGAEFLAAAEAAERVGARVLLADRPQAVTMRRLQAYTRQLQVDARAGRALPGSDGEPGALPGFMARAPEPAAEAAGATSAADPWGLGTSSGGEDGSESDVKERLLRMIREGGCPRPNAVLQAAQRLLHAGLDPGAPLSAADVLEVRACGRTVVENFRTRALQGDDAWVQRLEAEGVAGAGGSVGAQTSAAAMRRVIVEERDVILARGLWEAAAEAGPLPVVGVVGAGHVRGIQRLWPAAGSAAAAARAEEYLEPPQSGGPSVVGVAVTGAVLGFILWKRPKAAAFLAGAVALTAGPSMVIAAASVRRFTGFTARLVDACERIDAGGGGGAEDAAGWPAEGGDWQ